MAVFWLSTVVWNQFSLRSAQFHIGLVGLHVSLPRRRHGVGKRPLCTVRLLQAMGEGQVLSQDGLQGQRILVAEASQRLPLLLRILPSDPGLLWFGSFGILWLCLNTSILVSILFFRSVLVFLFWSDLSELRRCSRDSSFRGVELWSCRSAAEVPCLHGGFRTTGTSLESGGRTIGWKSWWCGRRQRCDCRDFVSTDRRLGWHLWC